MKKYEVPEKIEKARFVALGPKELKKDLKSVVNWLKVHDKDYKWNDNNAILAALSRFILDIKKEM